MSEETAKMVVALVLIVSVAFGTFMIFQLTASRSCDSFHKVRLLGTEYCCARSGGE